jgi:hypothetical protein
MFAVSLLVSFFVLCQGQTYQVFTTYANTGCSGTALFIRAVLSTCTPGVNSCNASYFGVSCTQGRPPLPSGGVQLFYFRSDSTCSNSNPDVIVSWPSNICVQDGADSFWAGCSGGSLFAVRFTQTNICLGQGYYFQFEQQCRLLTQNLPAFNISAGSGFTMASCVPLCFHEDSKIELSGSKKVATLSSLLRKEHPECHVPHQVQAAGVSITNTCSKEPLRLTNDHLVFTGRGLIPAADLKLGDELFGDVMEKKKCLVTARETEIGQRYFGLNCRDSIVLANGVKTSTFGVSHTVPAFWMQYASWFLGVERASTWGDSISHLLQYLGFV